MDSKSLIGTYRREIGHDAEKKTRRTSSRARLDQINLILAGLHGEADPRYDHSCEEERKLRSRVYSVADSRPFFNSLASRDYLYLKTLPIQAAPHVLPLLLPQSVCGRAQNGHGMFFDEQSGPASFPDATIDDVILAVGSEELGLQSRQVRFQRQQLLKELGNFLDRVLSDEVVSFGPVDDPERNPLGIKFLEGVSFEAASFFKGFILCGLMDNWKLRRTTADHFKVTLSGEPLILGAGESLVVDREKFLQAGLTEQIASEKEFGAEELDNLRDLGVIIQESAGRPPKKAVGMYFRRMVGLGISDDAALIYLGKIYGEAAMYGGLLADAADTYDKYVEVYVTGGYDELLVASLLSRLGGLDSFVSKQEIRRLIYFSAKANEPPLDISSSHRRLLQIEPGGKVSTFLNHLCYVRGDKPARIPLGYNRFDSDKFYRGISQRAEVLKMEW